MAHDLPATGFVRAKQIIGDRKAEPPIPPLIPVCKAAWWNGVRDGIYPPPLKLGENTTVWRVEHIRQLIQDGAWCPVKAEAIRRAKQQEEEQRHQKSITDQKTLTEKVDRQLAQGSIGSNLN